MPRHTLLSTASYGRTGTGIPSAAERDRRACEGVK